MDIEKIINELRLDFKQSLINQEYKKKGLTDEILEKQISLNKERNKLDIPDSKQKIFEDYVQ